MGSQDQKHEQRKSQQTAVRKTARASENLRLVKKKKKKVNKDYAKCILQAVYQKHLTHININKNPTRSNSMQSDLFYCKITLHVSGVRRAHHQEY
jgi:hypothetical protein